MYVLTYLVMESTKKDKKNETKLISVATTLERK